MTVIRGFLANIAVKHRYHTRFLLGLLAAGILLCGAWLAHGYWTTQQVHAAQQVVNSQFKDIRIESKSFNSEWFHGYAAYVVTENASINQGIGAIVDAFFLPCKEAGQYAIAGTTYECNASFTIDFATPDYLQVTYNFREHTSERTSVRSQGLLFDRRAGKLLVIGDLFKPGSSFLEPLASLARKALETHFGSTLSTNAALKSEVLKLTEPKLVNFSDFALTSDETLRIVYDELSAFETGGVATTITVPVGSLYDQFDGKTIDTFFPKLKEQKEAERKLAEEAKRKAEEAEAARRGVRQQVAANRSNIDCAVMKCISLTFDDGPHPSFTNQIIDILHQRQAVATFFVLGSKVASGAGTIQRAVSLHNEIANHTWSHPQLTNLSNQAIADEVQRTDAAIFNVTGSYPKLLRPPYGAVDARVQSQINMAVALWNVDTQDWLNRNADVTYQRAMAGARPGGVILMHDVHGTTVQATARIIDALQGQGYVLVTMSELFGIEQGNLSNFAGSILRGR